MSHYRDPRQQAFAARQNATIRLVDRYGRNAPGAMAANERFEAVMAENAVARALGTRPTAAGPLRRWLAARLVGFGTRLGGLQAGLEQDAAGLADGAAASVTP